MYAYVHMGMWYMCMCIGVHRYAHIYEHMEKVGIRHLPQFLSISSSQTRSLSEYGAYLQERLAIKLQEFTCL